MTGTRKTEHAEHARAQAAHGGNKKIALPISVLALFLAFSETLGKSARTPSLASSNDLRAFFQARHPHNGAEYSGRK